MDDYLDIGNDGLPKTSNKENQKDVNTGFDSRHVLLTFNQEENSNVVINKPQRITELKFGTYLILSKGLSRCHS